VSWTGWRLRGAPHVGLLSTSPPAPRMATIASNFQERAMHGSELPPLAAPPMSIPCGGCRNEMRLTSVDPTNEKTVYIYGCSNGHQRQFSTTDPTSIGGLPTVQPIAGPSPPEPSEIFSGARNNVMPLVSVAQETGPQFIWGACCGTGLKRSFRRLSETSTWDSSSKFSGNRACLPAKF
jgi:hypothetical protein